MISQIKVGERGQAYLAIQNARLFHEIEDKSRQLAEASRAESSSPKPI